MTDDLDRLGLTGSENPYIKLIELALYHKQFSVGHAVNETGLHQKAIRRAARSLFVRPGVDEGRDQTYFNPDHNHFSVPITWELSPEAFFGYLSHKQREDSNRHAWITHVMVFASIIISATTLLVVYCGWGAAGG
jgi:hypothetical protein